MAKYDREKLWDALNQLSDEKLVIFYRFMVSLFAGENPAMPPDDTELFVSTLESAQIRDEETGNGETKKIRQKFDNAQIMPKNEKSTPF